MPEIDIFLTALHSIVNKLIWEDLRIQLRKSQTSNCDDYNQISEVQCPIRFVIMFHRSFAIKWHEFCSGNVISRFWRTWRTHWIRRTLKSPNKLFGVLNSSEGSHPSRKSEFFGPDQKVMPTRLISNKKNSLLLHSWRPLTHKSQIECTSPSRSKIQYICSLPLSKRGID